MTFLLRAALVIGALSYLALMRGGADPAAEARKLAGRVPGAQEVMQGQIPGGVVPAGVTGAILGRLAAQGASGAPPSAPPPAAAPAEPRERARDAMARGLMAELARRAGEAAEPASRDTLEEADRRPAWRGVEPR